MEKRNTSRVKTDWRHSTQMHTVYISFFFVICFFLSFLFIRLCVLFTFLFRVASNLLVFQFFRPFHFAGLPSKSECVCCFEQHTAHNLHYRFVFFFSFYFPSFELLIQLRSRNSNSGGNSNSDRMYVFCCECVCDICLWTF